MTFWIITAGLAALVALLLISALRRGRASTLDGAASDMAVYRDQLAEIDADQERDTHGSLPARA